MVRIILDTNFLLIPSQFKVDIFSEIQRVMEEKYKLYVLDKTVDELNKIIKSPKEKQRNKLAASIALQLIKVKGVTIIKTKAGNVDDLLVEKIKKEDIVATQDKELKRRLPCRILYLRQKKILALST